MVRNKRPPNTAACDTAYLTGPVEQKPQVLMGCRTEATVSSLPCGPLRHGGLLQPSAQAERPGARERASKKEAIAISEGTPHHRTAVPFLRSESLGAAHTPRRDMPGPEGTGRRGPWGATAEAGSVGSPGGEGCEPGIQTQFLPRATQPLWRRDVGTDLRQPRRPSKGAAFSKRVGLASGET